MSNQLTYKSFIIVLNIACLLCLSSCDPCSPRHTPDPSAEIGELVFSALTINNDKPSIYTVNSDGTKLRKVITEGILCSAPSNNGRIAYLSKNNSGEKIIMRAKLDGSDLKNISPNRTIGQYIFMDLVNPIMSPDGNIISFSAGDGHLWETSYDGGLFSDISSMFCEGTTPSISPNGKFLAYFQGESISNALTIRIVDVLENPPVNYVYKEYLFGVNEYRGEPTISWSKTGNLLSYVITQSGVQDAIIINKNDLSDELAIPCSNIGAFTTQFSPQEDRLVYCGRDGNLYLLIIAYESKIIKLTNTELPVINIYPQFSADGKKLCYTRYYSDQTDIFSGVIEVLNIDYFLGTGKREVNLIKNNAYRAFWTNKN